MLSMRSILETPASVKVAVFGLLVHRVVTLGFDRRPLFLPNVPTRCGTAAETGNDAVDGEVLIGRLLGWPGDNKRRPRFVDEDIVNLVDDTIGQLPLDVLLEREFHVVTQVIEPELVIGPVGDVRLVSLPPIDRAQVQHPIVLDDIGRVEQKAGVVDDGGDR